MFSAEHTVKMLNAGTEGPMVFEPSYLKISPGDIVDFKAVDLAHNSVAYSVPDGAQKWEGKIDQDISVTLDTAGVYRIQ